MMRSVRNVSGQRKVHTVLPVGDFDVERAEHTRRRAQVRRLMGLVRNEMFSAKSTPGGLERTAKPLDLSENADS